MMSLTFYVVMLVITIIGVIASIVALCYGDTSAVIGLFLCGIFSIYWGHEVVHYGEDKVVKIKTEVAPQIDTVVTNRADTLFIYNFTNPIDVDK